MTISGNGLKYVASPIPDRPGRYQTQRSVIFKSGETYTLTVKNGGQILTSETTIPNSLEINSNTLLKEYTCNDGTTLPIKEIRTNPMKFKQTQGNQSKSKQILGNPRKSVQIQQNWKGKRKQPLGSPCKSKRFWKEIERKP